MAKIKNSTKDGEPMTVPEMPNPIVEAKPAAPVTEAPAVETTTEEPAVEDGLPGFVVSIKDNPELFIPATETVADRMDAIEEYKVRCGILSSIHPFDVRPDTRKPE